jgi:hypothetical protein
MLKQILVNNLIMIVIYGVFGFLSYWLLFIVAPSLKSSYILLIYIFSALLIPLICYVSGRLLLSNTGTVQGNISSVILLALILIVCIIIAPDMFNMIQLPFFPVVAFLSFLPSVILIIIASFLPSLVFYLGMISQSK